MCDEGPLWLSHHRSHQNERCVQVASLRICRRCLVMYPTIVATALTALAFDVGGGAAIGFVVGALMIPFLVEWVAEQVGGAQYSATRQSSVSAVAAIGGGIALAVHMHQPFDPWVTAPVAVAASLALFSALFNVNQSRRRTAAAAAGTDDWVRLFSDQEAERSARLRQLLVEHAITADRQAS